MEVGSLAIYEAAGTTATGSLISQLVWDNTNGRLGIGTSSPVTALTVKNTGTQLTLAYDDNNYVDFAVQSDGALQINGSGVTGSVFTIGNNTAEDIGIAFDNATNDFWMGIDDTVKE